MKHHIKSKLIVIIITIVIFYIGLTLYSDIDKITTNFQKIHLFLLIPIFSTAIFVMFLSSLRQHMFLKNIGIDLGIKNNFFLYVSGLSMIITPFGSGQLVKSFLMEKKYGFSVYKTAPLIIIERFCDLLATCIVILTTLLFFYSTVSIIVLLFSLGLLTVFIVVQKNNYFAKILLALVKKIPILSKINQFEITGESLKTLFNIRLILKAVCFTTLIIFVEAFVINMGFLSFGIGINYFESTQIFYTSLLIGALSLIPGGVGATEGGFIGLLLQRHFDLGIATSIVLFIRFTTVWFATAFGSIMSYFFTRRKIFRSGL